MISLCYFLLISTCTNLYVSLHPCTRQQDQVAGKLDPTAFPYVKDTPPLTPAPSLRATPSTGATSLRSAKPSWHRAARPGATQESKQRVLVFVAGGMTFSEMREAYALSKSLSKEVVIGMYLDRSFIAHCLVVFSAILHSALFYYPSIVADLPVT